MGNQEIRPATDEDGAELTAPRVAVPDDKGGGRYVGGVIDIPVRPVG